MALTNANIPYPDFVLHTVIDPDKFDLNNAELQGKLNATITQVNLNTPEIALKAYKTYVDTQDATLQSQLNSQNSQIALKANSADVYTKAEVDTSLNGKADKTTTYTKTEVDSALSLKANSSDVTTQLATKANVSTTYSKTEVDSLLSPKATTAYVDTQLSSKANTIDVYSKATLNDTGTASGATLIGSQAISGVTGTTVRSQIVSLKSQIDTISAGTIPDGSVTPAKLDRAYLQLTGGNLTGNINTTADMGAFSFWENGVSLVNKYLTKSGGTMTGTLTGTTINATTALQENGVALSSTYLALAGGTLTGNTTLTKAGSQAIFDIGSTTDDTRIRFLTSGAKTFIQSGSVAGAGKDLEIAGWNGNSIPVLTLRATSTITTGTITGTTINATTALQEAGTPLSTKYVQNQKTAWTNLSLSNGWTNAGAPFASLSYRKNASGEVELRGALTPGTVTIDTLIATLPVGFRPTHQRRYVVAQAMGTTPQAYGGAIQIETTGIIKVLLSHATNTMSFDSIPPIAVD